MYHIKQDQRSRNSAEIIFNALADLIAQQPYASIKISELVQVAGVARGTFYRNFDSIDDVLRWRCDQVVDDLINYLIDYRRTHEIDLMLPVLKPVLHFFYSDSQIIELLNSAERIDIFQAALQKRLAAASATRVSPHIDAKYHTYASIMRSGAASLALAHWVREGKHEGPDELADGLSELAAYLFGLR